MVKTRQKSAPKPAQQPVGKQPQSPPSAEKVAEASKKIKRERVWKKRTCRMCGWHIEANQWVQHWKVYHHVTVKKQRQELKTDEWPVFPHWV